MNKLDLTVYMVNEELTPKQKKIVDNWVTENKEAGEDVDPSVHDDLFHRYTNDRHSPRFVIPLSNHEVSFNSDVASHLHQNGGWTIHDYAKGIATRKTKTKKGFIKPEYKSIGTILHETGGQDKHVDSYDKDGNDIKKPLTDVFRDDPLRANTKTSNMQIVISRHPYDIGGMTSGRKWESTCMRLPHGKSKNKELHTGGEHHSYIQSDLSHQTIAAYLTHAGDNTINNPIARVLLKRHTNMEGHDIWRPEGKIYGNDDGSFRKSVMEFARKEFPSVPGEKYKKHPDLYNDDDNKHIIETPIKHTDYMEDVFKRHGFSENATVISKKTDITGKLHTDNDTPSLVVHDGNQVHKMYHNSGELHRDDAPAHIHEVKYPDGGLKSSTKYYYQHGDLHSPKDGITPSIETTEYDKSGTVNEVSKEYHKFGLSHNGIMSGLSSFYAGKHGVGVTKSLYGEAHTDNDEPSRYNLTFNRNGTKGYETASWAKHGVVTREKKTEYDENGSPLDHYEYNHSPNLPNGTVIKHEWNNGKGVLRVSIGDGHSVEHIYEHHEPTSSPSNIKTSVYRDANQTIIKNPHEVEKPDFELHTENADVIKHYDENGKLHSENGPAILHVEKKGGDVVKYRMSMMNHGAYDIHNTKVGDIVHHEYDGKTDSGKVLHNNGHGSLIQTEFTGGYDGFKKKANITTTAHVNSDGMFINAKDGSPNVLTKNGFTYVDTNQKINSEQENVPSSGVIHKKTKEHQIGKTISVYGIPMGGRKLSIEPTENGTVVKSESHDGVIIHHTYDDKGNFKGSKIDMNNGEEPFYADHEGNFVDKNGYGVSLSKERGVERNHKADYDLMSNQKPLHHITSMVNLPHKLSL